MNNFPSIPHLSFSPQVHSDDIITNSSNCSTIFADGKTQVIIHEKLDGGNCCIFKGNVYARTHKHPTKHPWFEPIKAIVRSNAMFYEPPIYDTYMIFGENMTAIHSIKYTHLSSYFYVFAIMDVITNEWLSMMDTLKIAKQLHLETPPVIFEGVFNNLQEIKILMDKEIEIHSCLGTNEREGFVIRIAHKIDCNLFSKSIAKYVRKGHIQTGKNWTRTWKKHHLIRKEIDLRNKNINIGMKNMQISENESKIDENTNNNSSKKRKKKIRKIRASLKTSLIICVGIQGSGKSSFAQHLCKYNTNWKRAGTDLFGNKNAVFSFIARMNQTKNRKKVIVENCNVSKKKRAELLGCAFNPKDAICVYFDISIKVCLERVNQRENHSTGNLFHTTHKSNRILKSFAKQMEIPDVKSESFKEVIVIHNNGDINRLLVRLGVSQPLMHANVEDNVQLYASPMARMCNSMDIKRLCSKLKLHETNDVLNVYIIGSRVWTSTHSQSDWDCIIIVKERKNNRVFQSIDNIDAYVLDEKQWLQELIKHRFLCWMSALFLCSNAVWKQSVILPMNDCCSFNYKMFVEMLEMEVAKDLKKMKKFEMKRNIKKVKKTFIHSLRMVKIAYEMIEILLGEYGNMGDIPFSKLQSKAMMNRIHFQTIENNVHKIYEQNTDHSNTKYEWQAIILKQCLKQCHNLIRNKKSSNRV